LSEFSNFLNNNFNSGGHGHGDYSPRALKRNWIRHWKEQDLRKLAPGKLGEVNDADKP
jgi:hypothetical protein